MKVYRIKVFFIILYIKYYDERTFFTYAILLYLRPKKCMN